MNIKDKKYLNEKILFAQKAKIMYKKLDKINEYNFWIGYLNALDLLKLNVENNYKFE